MPHHCADALSYQYHGILGFLTSQEGGRLIEIVSALTGTYAVAPRPIRRGLDVRYSSVGPERWYRNQGGASAEPML